MLGGTKLRRNTIKIVSGKALFPSLASDSLLKISNDKSYPRKKSAGKRKAMVNIL